jgi:rare lipoprotein A
MSRAGLAGLAVALATGCAHGPGGGGEASQASGDVEQGLASYYSDSLRGRPTASGARYDPAALTCAHRSLPFGTRLRVTELAHGRSVVVTVNDRGPIVRGRVVDLSRAAAAALGMLEAGVARVRLERLRTAGSGRRGSGRPHRLGQGQDRRGSSAQA